MSLRKSPQSMVAMGGGVNLNLTRCSDELFDGPANDEVGGGGVVLLEGRISYLETTLSHSEARLRDIVEENRDLRYVAQRLFTIQPRSLHTIRKKAFARSSRPST
jgi:hypothetical protein